jgi:hypothetical protein
LIAGRVDEHESESIWIRIEGNREIAASLRRIVEAAEAHAGRLQKTGADD